MPFKNKLPSFQRDSYSFFPGKQTQDFWIRDRSSTSNSGNKQVPLLEFILYVVESFTPAGKKTTNTTT